MNIKKIVNISLVTFLLLSAVAYFSNKEALVYHWYRFTNGDVIKINYQSFTLGENYFLHTINKDKGLYTIVHKEYFNIPIPLKVNTMFTKDAFLNVLKYDLIFETASCLVMQKDNKISAG